LYNLLKVKVSQYISLTKFDKGKLLALERDRIGLTASRWPSGCACIGFSSRSSRMAITPWMIGICIGPGN
jgi:hypothetical protein